MIRMLILAVFAVVVGCGPAGQVGMAVDDAAEFPVLTGSYLGQEPPGVEPVLFAPGIVSTGLATRDVAMTPDGNELYFSTTVGARTMIMVSRRAQGVWSEPVVAPFSGRYLDVEPCISADGSRFFFLSTRPQPGQEPKPGWVYQDIWVMDREGDSWGAPYNLGAPINSDAPEYFPSVTVDGTLYFTREGSDRVSTIFRSRLVDGVYSDPEPLGPEVNCGRNRFNAYVAPDESFVIVPAIGREDSLGGVDYYVVFHDGNGAWSEPVNMGPKINRADGREWSASLSPDGRYLFFMSSRTTAEADHPLTGTSISELLGIAARPGMGSSDIWWVDASIIDDLQPYLQTRLSAQSTTIPSFVRLDSRCFRAVPRRSRTPAGSLSSFS